MSRTRNPFWYIACMILLLGTTFTAAIFFYCRFASASSVPTMATWIWRGLSILLLSYLAYIIIRAFFYRTPGAADPENLPGCTVLIPAYNEGKSVSIALESLLACDYPAEKMVLLSCKKKKKIRRRNSHSLVADQNTQHTYTRVSLEPDRHRFSFLLYHLLALSFWTSDSSLDGKTYSYAEFL